MSLKIRYLDVPVGAQENAQVESHSGQPFSAGTHITAGVAGGAWASLEADSWRLDGSRKIMTDSASKVGWWSSERSGADGCFSTPVCIVLTFEKVHTASGITFTFCPEMDQWCSRVRVVWFNNQTQLAQVEARPNAARWTLSYMMEGFDRLEIYLLETNLPGQFAKLQLLQIGQEVWFGKEELAQVQLLNETDPTLCQISVDTMKVTVYDRKAQNLAPQRNQRMELYRDDTLLAVQYIDTFQRKTGQQYTFSCQSAIGLLEQTHLGGMYQGISLRELLLDVLAEHQFAIDPVFDSATVSGYLPVQTRRQALQQIAFAIGAMVSSQRDGVIHLAPLSELTSGVFTNALVFSGGSVKKTAQVGKVEVYAHSYHPIDEQEKLLDAEVINGENLLCVFSEPHHSYVISGGQIIDSGCNWVRIGAAGAVTLTGKKYSHTTTVFSKYNPFADAMEIGNVVTVDKATLVHTGNVSKALEGLYRAKKWNHTLTQEAILDGFSAGQRVFCVNPWGTVTEGIITGMDSTLTQNGQTGQVIILGTEQDLQSVHYYAGQLQAGDSEVPY